MMLVAAAGPAMNFVLAWLAALLLHGDTLLPDTAADVADTMLQMFILANLVLGLFNLLPIPPLDGGRIVVGLLPERLAMAWARLERAGIVIVSAAGVPGAATAGRVRHRLRSCRPRAEHRTALGLRPGLSTGGPWRLTRRQDPSVLLHLDGFEGPMDLLLDLARGQKVDLARISILSLVEQYLAIVEGARRVRLELAADWLVMAAWLTLLKSRLLLPSGVEDPAGFRTDGR